MRTELRHTAIALVMGGLITAAASCARARVDPVTAGVEVSSHRLGWYTKRVVAKRAPESLMAEDGTICRLAADRFRDTPVGTLLHGNWQRE